MDWQWSAASLESRRGVVLSLNRLTPFDPGKCCPSPVLPASSAAWVALGTCGEGPGVVLFQVLQVTTYLREDQGGRGEGPG